MSTITAPSAADLRLAASIVTDTLDGAWPELSADDLRALSRTAVVLTALAAVDEQPGDV